MFCHDKPWSKDNMILNCQFCSLESPGKCVLRNRIKLANGQPFLGDFLIGLTGGKNHWVAPFPAFEVLPMSGRVNWALAYINSLLPFLWLWCDSFGFLSPHNDGLIPGIVSQINFPLKVLLSGCLSQPCTRKIWSAGPNPTLRASNFSLVLQGSRKQLPHLFFWPVFASWVCFSLFLFNARQGFGD